VDYWVARVEATEGRSDFPTVPFILYDIIALALQFHIHSKNVNSLRSVKSYQYLIVVRFFKFIFIQHRYQPAFNNHTYNAIPPLSSLSSPFLRPRGFQSPIATFEALVLSKLIFSSLHQVVEIHIHPHLSVHSIRQTIKPANTKTKTMPKPRCTHTSQPMIDNESLQPRLLTMRVYLLR